MIKGHICLKIFYFYYLTGPYLRRIMYTQGQEKWPRRFTIGDYGVRHRPKQRWIEDPPFSFGKIIRQFETIQDKFNTK